MTLRPVRISCFGAASAYALGAVIVAAFASAAVPEGASDLSTAAVEATAPAAISSDEFSGTALDTSVWRVVDPLGDSSVSVGTGRLRVSLPAGRAHDLWQGALHAPRVLQAAAD